MDGDPSKRAGQAECYHKDMTKSKEGLSGGSTSFECSRSMNDIKRKIRDACCTAEKLMPIEVIYISMMKTEQNTDVKRRGWEITQKYYFKP